MARVGLLSTDFDGTLVGHPSDGRCAPEFAGILQEHQKAGGLWAINTGRSLEHLIEGLDRFAAPICPDFAITHEREIYQRRASGEWSPLGEWNRICKQRHDTLFAECGNVWEAVRELVESRQDVTMIEDRPYPEGLVTTSEEVMAEVCEVLNQFAEENPDLGYQRNTIYLRFSHREYHKGSALAALTANLGIDRAIVMAAGDHFNDLSMLDGSSAELCCCPANAIAEVRDLVRRSGGYVAARTCAEGVAEAYDWFINRGSSAETGAV